MQPRVILEVEKYDPGTPSLLTVRKLMKMSDEQLMAELRKTDNDQVMKWGRSDALKSRVYRITKARRFN